MRSLKQRLREKELYDVMSGNEVRLLLHPTLNQIGIVTFCFKKLQEPNIRK